MATLAELNVQIKELDERIAALRAQMEEMRNRERSKVIDEIRTKIAEYGLTASDLRLMPAAQGRRAAVAKASSSAEPKYRSPTGETWSGGPGRKPRWVTEALAAGKSMEDFSV
ncbi:MAG: H-NS histone family protein [Cytophagaceae bacterium]|nr:MAG: H-NS histone family protein [Cytophagaceae bacterium]